MRIGCLGLVLLVIGALLLLGGVVGAFLGIGFSIIGAVFHAVFGTIGAIFRAIFR
ncbi:MAG TPA: hypothetical protein GX512_00100 [Firmicutes bacterium]|nr:hypothetical protein [Candidatus Fermentithermobacillaceae bacterium]